MREKLKIYFFDSNNQQFKFIMSSNTDKLVERLLLTDPKSIFKLEKLTQDDIEHVVQLIENANLSVDQKHKALEVLEAMKNKYEIAELDAPSSTKT